MSKGVNVSFNLPEALWDKLLASEGSPGAIIVAALECYFDTASCVAAAPAGDADDLAPAKPAAKLKP